MEFVSSRLIVLFFVVLLGAGVASIMFASYLLKKYRLPFLRSYLYYQILTMIFGVYGLLGTLLAKTILDNLESPPQMAITIGHLIPFLGIPFLVAGFYMFIKMCWELVDKTISRKFTFGFYTFHLLFFLGYGIVILKIPEFEAHQYDNVSELIMMAFVTLELIVLLIAVIQLFLGSRSIDDAIKKKTIQNFAFLTLIIHLIGIALFIFSDYHLAVGAVYLFVFFASDILPLLYLGSYLSKHHTPEDDMEISDFTGFYKKHEITRREIEIIQLVSQGKTNKEIAEALFITLQTVKDHTHRIYTKTGVRNRVALINLLRELEE